MSYVKVLPVKTTDHLVNIAKYTTNEIKTLGGELVTCNGCMAETIYKDFRTVQKMNGYKNGLLAHQLIQSFAIGEIDGKAAHEIGKELADCLFPGYQHMVCTHIDAEHINTHIIFNSVSAEMGKKYHSNKATLAIVRDTANDISRKYGLSIINSTKQNTRNGIDKTTYFLATEGKSWKVALLNDLDSALATCKSKDEFIAQLEKAGYKVNYQNSNIVITKQGQAKGIRVDTLAKQFGDEYTKENIERKLNGLTYIKKPHRLVQEDADYKKSEWQRYEKYVFAQKQNKAPTFKKPSIEARKILRAESSIKYTRRVDKLLVSSLALAYLKQDKKAVAEAERIKNYSKAQKTKPQSDTKNFGNITYRRLVSVGGGNTTIKISAADKHKLQNTADFFFAGSERENGDILITFKSVNTDKVSQCIGIDIKSIQTYGELAEQRFLSKELSLLSSKKGTQICSFDVDNEQLKRLDKLGVGFFVFNRQGRTTISMLSSEINKEACAVLNIDYDTQIKQLEAFKAGKQYSELKRLSQELGEKLNYRIITATEKAMLEASSLRMAAFTKGDKYNVAFLESDLKKYKDILYQQQAQEKQEKEPQSKTKNIHL